MNRFIRFKPAGASVPIALYLFVLALSAVTAQAQPRESKDTDMGACQLLGRVSGDSGYGKNNGWQALAKYQALQRAEKLGASDVVWVRFTPSGAFNGTAEGQVYRCGGQRSASLPKPADADAAQSPDDNALQATR
jgi:hypothetical protein